MAFLRNEGISVDGPRPSIIFLNLSYNRHIEVHSSLMDGYFKPESDRICRL
jgi:hypothetical protein